MLQYTTSNNNTTQKVDSTHLDTPSPSSFSRDVELNAVNTTDKRVEVSQHLFNTTSTTIQHPLNVDLKENAQTIDEDKDTETQEFIQHMTKNERERGCVEQAHCESVLQDEQIANSPTTQQDTSFRQTNSLDPTSQQKAFQQKYQPVEVLNSEGEWIGGYFVHQCLVVPNLEGVERKYALYDKRGAKYTFLGEIRLPRASTDWLLTPSA